MIFKKAKHIEKGRRIACSLLAGALLISLLSGCNGEKATPTSNANASSSTSKEATKPPSTTEKLPSSAESEQQTSAPESSSSSVSEAAKPQTTADSKQLSQVKELAKKRIESDIDLALWYVNSQKDNGSKVSFPYKGGKAAYSKLNKSQKKLYNEMLPKIKALTPFRYSAEKYGYDVLDDVLNVATAISADHPECGIYFDIGEEFEGDMTTALKSVYFLPGDPDAKNVKKTAKLKKELAVFEEECNLIVEAIPEDFSTYDKYRYLAALISIRTGYDHSFTGGKQTSTAYGAIEGGTAICQGYSTAFEYLCSKANLWCKQVSGISQGVSHAWNLVKLESGTYHVDVTWADADLNSTLDDGWQRYFMLTQEQILEDHEIDDGTISTGTPLN